MNIFGNEEINKFPIHNIPVQTTESWDDCNSASYDPKGYCERNEVLRKLDVEPASKRKNFYVTERNRIKRFTEENIKGIIENETIDKENEVKKSEEEKVIPKTSVNNTINECTPDSITNLLKQVKLGANKSFNSIQNN
ncbi:hypothetical protein NQ314_012606 [Rhamnusium bicolor]|uniref:Uncharacterized protein n=1 Tax=Rhamnusium bicolor TaxID=1586634 RepID=A0AAV8XBP2_9CUCU|nr:hypothetical protein NQ314_012606 [Rhamnusium bicolor]